MLPRGSIFIPRFGKEEAKLEKIFITRSPCVEPSDGRMINLVRHKPSIMPISMWEWLHKEFHFGHVIFGSPREGVVPTPETIAGGDLDGDTYLVCWDNERLRHIKPVRASETKEKSKIVCSGPARKKGDWWSAAQDVMCDINYVYHTSCLMGMLYAASKKRASESPQLMKDVKVILLASAFKVSFDLVKYGGELKVPDKIREYIPKHLHVVLAPPEESDERTSEEYIYL